MSKLDILKNKLKEEKGGTVNFKLEMPDKHIEVLNSVKLAVVEVFTRLVRTEKDVQSTFKALQKELIKLHDQRDADLGELTKIQNILFGLEALATETEKLSKSVDNKKIPEINYKRFDTIMKTTVDAVGKLLVKANEEPNKVEILKTGERLDKVTEEYDNYKIVKNFTYSMGKIVIELKKS